MFGEKPIKDLTVEQIRDELRTQYGMKDLSNCLGLRDLQDKLEYTRKTRLMTHGLRYGVIHRIGNKNNPSGVVILMHGLGDTASGLEGWALYYSKRLPHLLFVLPTSPVRHISVAHGISANAWYDIKNINVLSFDDENGDSVLTSADYISSLAYTTTQRYRVPSGRVVYAGFSQGGAMSLATGLTSTIAPVGIVSLSGYLAGSQAVLPRVRNKAVPILMCHGRKDIVVPIEAAEKTQSVLKSVGVASITLEKYLFGHDVDSDVFDRFEKFLKQVLPEWKSTEKNE